MSRDVDKARAEADAKREALLATASEVQSRLNLGTLAEGALERIRAKGEAEARKRPVAVALAAAGVAGLMAAGPLVKLARWAAGRNGDAPAKNGDRK